MARRFWTPARIAELSALWRAGQTAAAIGTALGGITRSAVLGKVFRLRLVPAAGGRLAQANADAPARRRAGKPQPVQAKPRRKPLFDLTNECCRWPYGELGSRRFFFCGAAGADVARGIPYCPRHMQRAYIVPPSLLKPSLLKPSLLKPSLLKASLLKPNLVKPKLRNPLPRPITRADSKISLASNSTRSFAQQRDSRKRKFG